MGPIPHTELRDPPHPGAPRHGAQGPTLPGTSPPDTELRDPPHLGPHPPTLSSGRWAGSDLASGPSCWEAACPDPRPRPLAGGEL